MAVSRKITCFNFFLNKECAEKECGKSTWYRWLQFFTGAAGFLGFVSYGSYIMPTYDHPITLGCFFISLVGLVNALSAVVKLVIAYRTNKKRNSSKSVGDIDIRNLEPSANATEEGSDVADSTMLVDEAERLRNMLRLALSPRGVLHTTEVPNKKPTLDQQYKPFLMYSPAKPLENRTNPNRKLHRFPSASKLRRTESYDSRLKFHSSYSSEAGPPSCYTSTQNGTVCSSSSDRDTYIYSSSSEGSNSSIYGWRKNPERMPLKITESNLIAQSEIDLTTHKTGDVEYLSTTGSNECPSNLPLDLPEEFPALPFPKRNFDDYRYTRRNKHRKPFRKQIVKAVPTVSSMTESRSMINIGHYEHKSRKELLTILANFSSVVSTPVRKQPKCSHRRRCKKHFVPRNLIMGNV